MLKNWALSRVREPEERTVTLHISAGPRPVSLVTMNRDTGHCKLVPEYIQMVLVEREKAGSTKP